MIAIEPTKPRRIELILRQIESLPTLPSVATRLLELTVSDDSHARQVVELISADPALTAKVLSLCRTAEKGIRDDVLTIDKAVVLLGFNSIRNAVLSIKVFGLFADDPPETLRLNEETKPFDREGFWLHCLAVGVMTERLAQSHPGRRDLYSDEAFVCGLLHDVGKLALDQVLPQSFARVVALADFNQGNIAEFERRIIGLDHHTAGKRLAEQWRLPHRLQDCIWLHGSAYETLPQLEHRNLIALVHLADMLCRQQHLGYSGNYKFTPQASVLIEHLKLDPATVERAIESLHDDVDERSHILGLNDVPTRSMFLQSIQRANEELGRVNQTLERRSRTAQQQSRMLDAIGTFHADSVPGQSVQDVLDAVAASAQGTLGVGFYALLTAGESSGGGNSTGEISGGEWLICQYNREAQAVHAQYLAPPPHAPNFSALGEVAMNAIGLLPWIADYLMEADDLRRIQWLPLSCGWGSSAILLHDRGTLPPASVLSSLTTTWGAAIAAAQQHEGARHLGEQLAESNAALAEAQNRLLRQESLARLGEMAAGAAHEMNNPLAVISGRSQLLTMTLNKDSKEHKTAQTIYRESHRLSDLITDLHMFAEPPVAHRQACDLSILLDDVINKVTKKYIQDKENLAITLRVKQSLDTVELDSKMIQRAVAELLTNAVLAKPKKQIEVHAMRSPGEEMVVIQVTDDGIGMDAYTLDHALDPFFSSRPAGRRVGMGLPRVQQFAQAHDGSIDLRSTPGEGTTVSMKLALQG